MRYPPATHSSIRCHRLSDLHSRVIPWLWQGWLALGEMVILDGDPGTGKSLLTLDLCARLSTGRPWPDGATAGLPCDVVLLNAEDNVHNTVRPRLQALGADLDHVHFLEGVVTRDGEEPLCLPTHALALRDIVQQKRAKLVVLDPLVAFLDRTVATHNDQSVRAALGVLAALAHEHECAMLMVRHLNKEERQRTLYRGGGSIGFLAAVRGAWLLAADPDQPRRRVLAPLKNNLREVPASLSFQIGGTPAGPQIAWLGTTGHSCAQLLERKPRRGRPTLQRERAEANLRMFLEEVPRLVEDVREFAKEQKISERTLNRIKQGLGIRSVRAPRGDRRATYWLLPGQLPEGVTEEMLTPMETREQEMWAAQEEMDEIMAELRRKCPGTDKVEAQPLKNQGAPATSVDGFVVPPSGGIPG